MDPIILRLIERIIAVIIGGISVYLGYKLFLHLPNQHDSEGRFILPGNISVYVSRVGPGVFFGLFGTAVVALSLYMAVTFNTGETIVVDASIEQSSKGFTGVGLNPANLEGFDLETQRLRVQQHLAFLNQLPPLLDPALSEEKSQRVQEKTVAAKLYLMRSVWGQDWGRFEDFELWAEVDGGPIDSEELRKAADVFAYGR